MGFSRRISQGPFLTSHSAFRKVCSDRIIVGWRRHDGTVVFAMKATEHGPGSQLGGLLMANGDDEVGGGRRTGGRRSRGWMMLLLTITAVLVAIGTAVVQSMWPSIGDAVELAVLVATLEAIVLQIYANANADH
jgi:hypothetical protein